MEVQLVERFGTNCAPGSCNGVLYAAELGLTVALGQTLVRFVVVGVGACSVTNTSFASWRGLDICDASFTMTKKLFTWLRSLERRPRDSQEFGKQCCVFGNRRRRAVLDSL